ncbi:MAG: class I SAM-dependent methyltransferase [Deltaproteobacteria bacterium]|nr:class I SAM-dependent methyltransferase [Deltaproteobacteria bacterium]
MTNTARKEEFSWSTFYAKRKEMRKVFPSVYKLKLRKKLSDVVLEELKGGEAILDVGASTRRLADKIESSLPGGVTYKTMDIDKTQSHDYYSIGEIKEKFDVIVLSEVIEHIEFMDGMKLLRELRGLLKAGGRLIVSTPNLNHPNRYWDSDHRTPYRYEELAGALLWAGFDVTKLYRIYNDQFIRRFIRVYVMSWLHKYLDVDFAKSIVAVARA